MSEESDEWGKISRKKKIYGPKTTGPVPRLVMYLLKCNSPITDREKWFQRSERSRTEDIFLEGRETSVDMHQTSETSIECRLSRHSPTKTGRGHLRVVTLLTVHVLISV